MTPTPSRHEQSSVGDPRAALERATQAEALANNRLLAELLDGLIAEGVRQWRESADLSVREQAWLDVRAVDRLRRAIASTIDQGTVARHRSGAAR
ncbi:MAG TPA: hypothetical protein VGR63_15200 [Casimicrobiaceae bacterium]|jgi:hypothetical protein|nr:hypothetical protein [Casimicrobiaceae bacterium]